MDWLDRMFFAFGGIFVCILTVIFGYMVTSLFYEFTGTTCNSKASIMGLESRYMFATGCMLKVNGQFLSASEVIPIERDGKIVFVTKTPYRLEVNK